MMKPKPAYKHFLVILFSVVCLLSGLLFPVDSVAQLIDPGDSTGNTGTNAPDSGIPIPEGIKGEVDLEQCAWDLTQYMNTVLDNVDPSGPSILTSISFNLTSPFERPLFQMMEVYGANFEMLEYFSGNTYTLRNNGVTLAYDFYVNQGWKADFEGKYGKEMIFTEYGDFVKHPDHGGADSYDGVLDSMISEFGRAIGAGNKVVYFAPFPGNPEFDFHNFDSESQFQEVVAANPSAAGANSAMELDSSGAFAQKVADLGMNYVLEIITGPNTEAVVNYINGLPDGVVPVIRSCWGTSCGMKDPLVLADFINSVDSQVSRPWHVLVGPNEPLTDPWVSSACGEGDGDREWEWEHTVCSATVDPEFHSLRPYPGSPCPESEDNTGSILMCANDLIAEQQFRVTREDVNPESAPNCQETEPTVYNVSYLDIAGNTQTEEIITRNYLCEDVRIDSFVEATIEMPNAELPVLGNTEDVPNAQSGQNALSFEQRVNNYVSWYLQGVIPTAEEDFASPTDAEGERAIINFSGPIHKLFPRDLMTGFTRTYNCGRRSETVSYPGLKQNAGLIVETESNDAPVYQACQFAEEADPEFGALVLDRDYVLKIIDETNEKRHDQIVVCENGFPEACYSRVVQNRLRKSYVQNLSGSDSLLYPYIPLSSTEDSIGRIRTKETDDHPTSDRTDWTDLGGVENPRYLDEGDNTVGEGDGTEYVADFSTADQIYYAHARESNQLAKLLQSTYIPDNFPSASEDNIPPYEDVEILPYCTIVDTYSNPGDNLYGYKDHDDYACVTDDGTPIEGRNPGQNCDDVTADNSRNIKAAVEYSADVECEFRQTLNQSGYEQCVSAQPGTFADCLTRPACEGNDGVEVQENNIFCDPELSEIWCEWEGLSEGEDPAVCLERHMTSEDCRVTLRTAFDVETESPYLKDIFYRLVYGNMSFFRRLYPRLAANNQNLRPEIASLVVPGPEGLIKNIPGETSISYNTITDKGRTNVEHLSDNTLAGDVAKQTPGSDAKMYFPYLGTIHQHFLTDVQCALRPASIGCDNTTFVPEGDESGDKTAFNTHLCPVWVDQSDANNYANTIKATLPNQRYGSGSFAGWVAYYGGILDDGPDGDEAIDNAKYQHLFETCGGTRNCYEYILNRVLSEGCSDSNSCINPYLVMAIALNENGGLISFEPDATSAKHFGCDPFGTAGFANTIEDKLTCVINTINNYNQAGLSDDIAMRRYGYANGAANSNINKLMDILSNQTYDPQCKDQPEIDL